MNFATTTRWTNRHRYRNWDGLDGAAQLSAEAMLDLLADDLITRDAGQVMNQALHQGLRDGTPGLDQLREQLRQQLTEQEKQLTGTDLQDIASALEKQTKESGNPTSADVGQLLQALSAHPGKLVQTLKQADPEIRLELQQQLDTTLTSFGDSDSQDTSALKQNLASLNALLNLVQTEAHLRKIRRVSDIVDIDEALLRQALEQSAVDQLKRLTSGLTALANSGYLQRKPQGVGMSPRAMQHIGNEMLREVFEQLSSRSDGEHEDVRAISGLERSGTSRHYEFGDPFDLNLGETMLNAIKRGEGTPVRLHATDMSIFEREETSRVATVLAIDTSRSMGDRGYLLAAKKLAITLSMLIRNRFPRDLLYIVGFSETARAIPIAEITDLQWDRFGLGTNVQDALRLSRKLLGAHSNLQKNLILLTDGEPTAYIDARGEPRFCQPPTAEALASTFVEATACSRDRVSSLIVLLSKEKRTVSFASELARRSAGNLIVTDPTDLATHSVAAYGQLRRQV